MKRKDFLKLSCTGCMLSAAGVLSVTSLLSCNPKEGTALYKAPVSNKQIAVPLSKLSEVKAMIVRGSGMDYDIAVRTLEDGRHEALLLRCTHFSNPLIVNGQGYSCTLHGSEFDGAGAVKKGPAAEPLKKLHCDVTATDLIIHV